MLHILSREDVRRALPMRQAIEATRRRAPGAADAAGD